MLSCREVTRLVASDQVERASRLRRLEFWLHVFYCRHCRRYVRELQALAKSARRLARDEEPDPVRVAKLERAIRDHSQGESQEWL